MSGLIASPPSRPDRADMAIRIFIDGAAGTTGLEIRERPAGRSEFELIVLEQAQRQHDGGRQESLHTAGIALPLLTDEVPREARRVALEWTVRGNQTSQSSTRAP